MATKETTIILKKASVDQYMMVDDAAVAMKMKPQTLRNALYAGHFTTYKFYSMTLISVAEIRAYNKGVAKKRKQGK